MENSTLKDRVSLIFDEVRNLSEFARKCGIKEGTLRSHRTGSKPNLAMAAAIARAANVRLEWLATGEGPMRQEEQGSNELPESEFSLVPRYDVNVSAGHGSITDEENIVDRLAFKTQWLKNYMGLSPSRTAIVTATGDSMEPTLHDRDILLVDMRVQDSKRDGVHILRHDNLLVAKRLQWDMDGTLFIKSDNPAYEKLTVFPERIGDVVTVIGRVVWVGKRI